MYYGLVWFSPKDPIRRPISPFVQYYPILLGMHFFSNTPYLHKYSLLPMAHPKRNTIFVFDSQIIRNLIGPIKKHINIYGVASLDVRTPTPV
jgi:hypothetical protein